MEEKKSSSESLLGLILSEMRYKTITGKENKFEFFHYYINRNLNIVSLNPANKPQLLAYNADEESLGLDTSKYILRDVQVTFLEETE